jgi:RF-1 domain
MAKTRSRPVERKSPKGEKIFSVTMADCDLQTFSAGGPGGQHQNTANTGVRIIHRASGAVGEARDNRSQLQNKQAAFRKMTEHPKFKVYLNRIIFHMGKSPEDKVKDDMRPENLRVETLRDGDWKVIG